MSVLAWTTLACSTLGCPSEGADAPGAVSKAAASKRVVLPAWGVAPPPASEAAFTDAELRRAPGDPGLAEALNAPDERRAQALWSLARIGGEAARHRLSALLDADARADADALATLALLMPPEGDEEAPEAWRELEDRVWTRYAVTEDAAQASALLLAIARIGAGPSITRLGKDLAVVPAADAAPELRRRYIEGMYALGILCSRGEPLDEIARDAVGQGLTQGPLDTREAAAYALGRCARISTEMFALAEEREVLAGRLAPAVGTGTDSAKATAWRAYAALGEIPKSVPDEVLGSEPPTWWIEVEAVRALVEDESGRELGLERLRAQGFDAFSGPRVHAVLVLLRGLRPAAAASREMEPGLREWASELDEKLASASGRRVRELQWIRCEVAVLEAIARGNLEALRVCRSFGLEPDPVSALEVEALLAMSDKVLDKDARVTALVTRAESPDPGVAAPAVAALAEVDDPRAIEVLRAALEREDIGVVAAAAGAIAARSQDAAKRSLDVVPALRRTVTGLPNGTAIEARLRAIEALGVLARRPERGVAPGSEDAQLDPAPWLESVILPLARDPAVAVRREARRALEGRPELLARFDKPVPVAGRDAFGAELEEWVAQNASAPIEGFEVQTSAGRFVIDVRGAVAPINLANLRALAQRGHFDGLRFHRVVPGFVVQGGDPRGDGYGGPGHLVPCEWSNHHYERGTVGIALAGKDTGGSQFFVTQTPQPHLDARYTVVGRVVRGMEVVDTLLPGDAIEKFVPIEKLDDEGP